MQIVRICRHHLLVCTHWTITKEQTREKQRQTMKYILVHWYLQPHGSFSSLGRWRDVSLTEFSTTEALRDDLIQYLEKNYPHRTITEERENVCRLCQVAVEESNQLLLDNRHEIRHVTSRHIWPSTHQLLIGCLIVEDEDLREKTFCLITQLGNRPTHVQFVRGATALRETLLQRFKNPFQSTVAATDEECELFVKQTEAMSTEDLCRYVTNRNFSFGVLVDFIVEGEPLFFCEPSI